MASSKQFWWHFFKHCGPDGLKTELEKKKATLEAEGYKEPKVHYSSFQVLFEPTWVWVSYLLLTYFLLENVALCRSASDIKNKMPFKLAPKNEIPRYVSNKINIRAMRN